MGYRSPRLISIVHNLSSSIDPAVTTTYYIGAYNQTIGTGAGTRLFNMPRSGRIRSCLLWLNATVAGSNEDWTWLIRNVTTATDYTFKTLGSASASRIWINDSLDIPLSASDQFQLKTTTPNWVAAPTGVYGWLIILIEVP